MTLDELERAQLDPRVSDTFSSGLFVNIIPENNVKLEDSVNQFKRIMDGLVAKYAARLLKVSVDEIEVKIRVIDNNKDGLFISVRLIASSSASGWLT